MYSCTNFAFHQEKNKILNPTKVKMLKSQLRTKNKVLLYKESDFSLSF